MQWKKANAICRQAENVWTMDDGEMMTQEMKAVISTRMEAGCSAPNRLRCFSRQEESKALLVSCTTLKETGSRAKPLSQSLPGIDVPRSWLYHWDAGAQLHRLIRVRGQVPDWLPKALQASPAQLWTTMWIGSSGNTHPTHLALPV